MRTRSDENQCYIVFAHPEEGLVVGPHGNLLARQSDTPGCSFAISICRKPRMILTFGTGARTCMGRSSSKSEIQTREVWQRSQVQYGTKNSLSTTIRRQVCCSRFSVLGCSWFLRQHAYQSVNNIRSIVTFWGAGNARIGRVA